MTQQGERERLLAELDSKLVSYFDLFTEYQVLHVELATHLKNGWWELGRARYAMGAGVNSITQRQYPAFMTATAHYPSAVETQETAQAPSSEDMDSLHKRTIKGQSGHEEGEKSASKQRKDTRTSESRGDTEPTAENDSANADENKSKNERERWKDPLHWFGLLPPLPLRTAQKEFKSVVEVVWALTTVKRKLHAAQEEYERLLAKKQTLSVQ